MRKSGKVAARVDALTKEEWEALQAQLDRPVTIMPFQPRTRGRTGSMQARYDYNGEFSNSY
jgi:hypothetical protein